MQVAASFFCLEEKSHFVRLHVSMNNTVAVDLPKEMQSHHYPILFEVEEKHWWYVGRRKIIQSLVERICATLNNPHPNILDVGCGTGANLKMLAAFGKAEGVDISPQAVEFCRQRGLDSVKLGAAEQLPYENNSFEPACLLLSGLFLREGKSPLEFQRFVSPQKQNVTWTGSVPPRGSGWVRSLRRTHPLPRGGTDPVQVSALLW